MDCVLGSERREDENLSCRRDCRQSQWLAMRVASESKFTWIETQKMPSKKTSHRCLIIVPGKTIGCLKIK